MYALSGAAYICNSLSTCIRSLHLRTPAIAQLDGISPSTVLVIIFVWLRATSVHINVSWGMHRDTAACRSWERRHFPDNNAELSWEVKFLAPFSRAGGALPTEWMTLVPGAGRYLKRQVKGAKQQEAGCFLDHFAGLLFDNIVLYYKCSDGVASCIKSAAPSRAYPRTFRWLCRLLQVPVPPHDTP